MKFAWKAVAVGCLLFALHASPVHADENSAWTKASVSYNYFPAYQLLVDHGQCQAQFVTLYDNGSTSFGGLCVTETQWGKIHKQSLSVPTVSNSSTFYPLQLDSNQQLLASPDSRRLYIQEKMSDDIYRVGFVDNPRNDLAYDTIDKSFRITAPISYLPRRYSTVALSNNSYFLAGVTSDAVIVTDLRDLSTFEYRTQDNPAELAGIKNLAVSNDGKRVFAAASDNLLAYHDLSKCTASSSSYKLCASRQLVGAIPTTEIPNSVFRASDALLYINDQETGVNYHSNAWDNSYFALDAWIDPSSLDHHLTYVALGDSFSSGEGDWNYKYGTDGRGGRVSWEVLPSEKCHQSYGSYAESYAQAYGSRDNVDRLFDEQTIIRQENFINITCSGAEQNDISSINEKRREEYEQNYIGQYDQLNPKDPLTSMRATALDQKTPGRALQIDFIKKYTPDIATIGIGGNDIHFADVLNACITSVITCPQASTEKWTEGKKIYDEFNKLDTLFIDLQKASPSTKFYAVGYPKIINDDDYYCGANVLLDAWEREYVKQGTAYLNQVIKAAAYKNGFGYIDFENTIGAEGLCGTGRGVNGLSIGDDRNQITILGKTVNMIANESYHPTRDGQELMSNKLINTYGDLNTATASCAENSEGICSRLSVIAPSIPSYFGSGNINLTIIVKQSTSATAGGMMKVELENFLRNSKVKAKTYSQVYNLGTFKVDSNGELNTDIKLPSFIEPGYHTLYFEGTGSDGQPLEYQQVILYLPDDTQLGPCGFLPYSNLDQDEDGIDDACDASIDVDNQQTFANPADYLTYPNPEQPRPLINDLTPAEEEENGVFTVDTLNTASAPSDSTVHGVLVAARTSNIFATSQTSPLAQLANVQPTQETTQTTTIAPASHTFLKIAVALVAVALAVGISAFIVISRSPSRS